MINDQYVRAIAEGIILETQFNNGLIHYKITDMFLQMAKDTDVDLEIKKCVNDHVVGFEIKCPSKKKALFMQDIYIEDESPENIAKAKEWFENKLLGLKQYDNKI